MVYSVVMTNERYETPRDLYLHGPKSICRNCGQHVSRHTSQLTSSSPFGRAYVCPATEEN
jgi:hypothetical protein